MATRHTPRCLKVSNRYYQWATQRLVTGDVPRATQGCLGVPSHTKVLRTVAPVVSCATPGFSPDNDA